MYHKTVGMDDAIQLSPNLPHPQIQLISGEELAESLKFSGITSAFRTWCAEVGIVPVPGRKNVYDPSFVRHRLNSIQNMGAIANGGVSAPSLTEQRRARRGT